MASNSDLQNINLRRYDVFFDEVSLGLTIEGSVSASINGTYTDVDNLVEIEGVVQSFERGQVPTVTMEFASTSEAFLAATLFPNRFEREIGSTTAVSFFGNRLRKLNDDDQKGVLRLHPNDKDSTDFSEDLRFPQAAARLEDFTLVSSRENIQTIGTTFNVFPDCDQPLGQEYGSLGDWSITTQTPSGVWIQASKFAITPGQTATAYTLAQDQDDRFHAYAAYSTNSAVTFDLDDAGGATATDKTLPFDGLSTANGIIAGQYLSFSTEFMYVESVAYTTSTTGTVTVIRGVWGSTAVTLVDDDTLTIEENIGIENATNKATWASSSAANVTVGDIFQGTGDTQKGKVAFVATGSANITATVNAVASPNLVITAS